MQRITEHFNKNLSSYIEILKKMVEINSYTKNTIGVNKLGEMTVDLFSPLGFNEEFFPSKKASCGRHLILRKSPNHSINKLSKPKTIALVSHLDTVFSPEEELQNDFKWRVDNDRIYGPGTVDIKGGTVMVYMIMDALNTHATQVFESVSWMIAFDACEETLSDEFGNIMLEKLPENTLVCLVFEGGTQNKAGYPLVVSRKGRATFNVRVEGKSAHAGNNHGQGANAILQISETIRKIESFTDYSKQLTFNVGTVEGGSVINRVPHFAEAGVEMRAFDHEVFNSGLQRILSLQGKSQVTSTDGFPCNVFIELVSQTEPWPINQATDNLFRHWAEAAATINLSVIPEARGGLSDGNLVQKHFPTLDGLGPTGGNAHCSEHSPDGSKEQEFVLISSFVPKALLNTVAIMRLISMDLPGN